MGATLTQREIESQPAVWDLAATYGRAHADLLLGEGRAVIFGCGTSAFVAQVVASLRERGGFGETDSAFASEIPARPYQHAVAICRSATTSEVLDALDRLDVARRVGITAVSGSVADELVRRVDDVVVLDFADEASVVQTRFPAAQLAMYRAATGDRTDFGAVATDALRDPLPDLTGIEHFVFLGDGARLGYANEAALKVREMAQAWSESHLAMDYRHGPIAVAGPHSLVVTFGPIPPGLLGELASTGATLVADRRDPLGQLVVAQRIALAACLQRGLDPDQPNRLTRSVVLGH